MTRHLARLGVVLAAEADRAALDACLATLRPAAAAGARVVVVDGSRAVAEWARRAHPFARVRSTADFVGSSDLGGCGAEGARPGLGARLHLGVQAVGRRDYLALLDPDARPGAAALAALVAALEEDPAAAIARPRLEWGSVGSVGSSSWARPIDGDDLTLAVVRRADWDLVGGTDAALVRDHVGEDLALRLARRGRYALEVDSVVVACTDRPPRAACERVRRDDRARFLARHGSGVSALLARGRLALTERARGSRSQR